MKITFKVEVAAAGWISDERPVPTLDGQTLQNHAVSDTPCSMATTYTNDVQFLPPNELVDCSNARKLF